MVDLIRGVIGLGTLSRVSLRKAADMPHAADGTRVSAAAWQKRVLTYNTCGWSMDGDLVMARERTGEVSVYTVHKLFPCVCPV